MTPLELGELLRKNMGLDNRLMVKNIISIADNGEIKFFGLTIKKGAVDVSLQKKDDK